MSVSFINDDAPVIHILDETNSSQDAAFALLEQDKLPVWGSVLAKKQTAGRGQMRRAWISHPGNLMISLRLPFAEPFSGQGGAIACATLFALALRELGFPIFIKWPNDLVYMENDTPCKAGGILLEEKKGALVAGVGINLVYAPDEKDLSPKPELHPCFLFYNAKDAEKPEVFWRRLLGQIISIQARMTDFASQWNRYANELLVWKGLNVSCQDSDRSISGILLGMERDGALLLQTRSGLEKAASGTLSKNPVSRT